MIYLITNNNMLKAKKVYNMKATEFLFICEYLIAKRIVEAEESKPNKNDY